VSGRTPNLETFQVDEALEEARPQVRPMLGTGIAVAITGIVLLGIGGLLGAEWERREIDKYLRRRGQPGG